MKNVYKKIRDNFLRINRSVFIGHSPNYIDPFRASVVEEPMMFISRHSQVEINEILT